MPVLGRYGTINLRRELPAPVHATAADVNFIRQSIFVLNDGYWSGDQVTLQSSAGIPIDLTGDGEAGCPEGYGFYAGGQYVKSPARAATSDTASFYGPDDRLAFYGDINTTRPIGTYYIFRNELDEISFYPTLGSALNNDVEFRFKLVNVDFGDLTISPSTEPYYQNAKAICSGKIGKYSYSDVIWRETGRSLCDYGPTYTEPTAGTAIYDNADVIPREELDSPWTFVASLTDWTLNLQAAEVNTSSLGDRFGENVKALVTGGGAINFLLDYPTTPDQYSPITLLRLMLMVEKGCKASAQFHLIEDEDEKGAALNKKPGLYYSGELLLTASALNMRADDLIAGTADFVTTGPLVLRTTTQEIKT
jgi:hypothetical protein